MIGDGGEDGSIRAAYDDSGGDLPAVVLIHGVGLSREMWSAQIDALRDRYRVVTPDMLGHGASPRPGREATLDDYADHVDAVITRAGIDRAAMVGFSMGALVARAFALRHPSRLTGLAFLNGVFARTPEVRASILKRVDEVATNGPSANIDAAIGRWFSPDFRASHPDYLRRLRRGFANNDPVGYETAYRLFATQDSFGSDRLGSINCPVLVATGELDVGSTPAMAHALAAHIPGAALRIVAGARHMMAVEMPAIVSALLLDFLKSLPVANGIGENA
ncbi:alpha/beta fold hydrolase [Sphingomonas bacterium]|uniref:alpha/beta fold hydrolase n=1 Tax=Sphingomonas bacterium TaxID=1895847 RepID=UPI001576C643|nr:alpha/beta hydrolase [Sphingomonas bacterium]